MILFCFALGNAKEKQAFFLHFTRFSVTLQRELEYHSY